MQKPEQRRDLTEMSCPSIAVLCPEAVECNDWTRVLVKKQKCQAGARGQVRGSSKSLGFSLWGQRVSVQKT